MTKPIEEIIPRNLDEKLASTLGEFSKGLEEIVNFGSNIISWDLNRKTGTDADLPSILFIRNFIEQIDAISILIKFSSVDPCKNLLRIALENFFYLEYLLETNTTERSMAYLYYSSFENNKILDRSDRNSPAFEKLKNIFSKDKLLKGSELIVIPDVEYYKELNNKLLESDNFQKIKNEFERVKKNKNRVVWYELFNGPVNVKEMADRLEFPAIYEILYRGWSTSVHSTNIIHGKLSTISGKEIAIIQIRLPKDAQSITQQCFNLAILVYKTYIEKKLPEKQTEFGNWYFSIKDFTMKLVGPELINIV